MSMKDCSRPRPHSKCIFTRDRERIREATHRHTMIVALAMSEPIKEVPRSAMLAFAENKVIFDQDDVDMDPESSSTRIMWAVRRSHTSKSTHVPKIAPCKFLPHLHSRFPRQSEVTPRTPMKPLRCPPLAHLLTVSHILWAVTC